MALALIVLFAQLGAQTHAYTHLASSPATTQHRVHTLPCAECSTFAPLLTTVSSTSYAAVTEVTDRSGVFPHLTIAVHRAAICRAYRSRAPPLQI